MRVCVVVCGKEERRFPGAGAMVYTAGVLEVKKELPQALPVVEGLSAPILRSETLAFFAPGSWTEVRYEEWE